VAHAKIEKLPLLADRYNVDLKEPSGPLSLCLCLAEEFVPGFKVVDEWSRKGPGAPRKEYFDLVKAVDLRVARYGETVLGACRKLSAQTAGPWHGEKPISLEKRYYEWLRAHSQQPPESVLVRRLEQAAERALNEKGTMMKAG
jgi:hypothetical protein